MGVGLVGIIKDRFVKSTDDQLYPIIISSDIYVKHTISGELL